MKTSYDVILLKGLNFQETSLCTDVRPYIDLHKERKVKTLLTLFA